MSTGDQDISSGDGKNPSRLVGASVDFFVLTPEALKAAKDVSEDRRMNSVKSMVREGGMPAATALYKKHDSPSLVVVEIDADVDKAFALLDELADACLSTTKLIVIGCVDHVDLYKDLIDRGVSDYIVFPMTTISLISAIERAIKPKNAKTLGKKIAVIGAVGGAGSSTVAHNLAFKLANAFGARTILADYDLDFGSVGLAFDLNAPQAMNQAIQSLSRLDDVLLERLLAHQGAHLSLLAGTAVLSDASEASEPLYGKVLDVASALAAFVVVDLPHCWSPATRRILHEADEVIVVTTPTLLGLRNTKHLFEALRAMRPNDPDPRLALNQTAMRKRTEVKTDVFTQALNCAPSATLAFDPALFSSAANEGKIVSEAHPNSAAAATFQKLAEAVFGPREAKERAGMLGKLRRILKL